MKYIKNNVWLIFLVLLCSFSLSAKKIYATSETFSVFIHPKDVNQKVEYGIWKLPDTWDETFLNREKNKEGKQDYDKTLEDLDHLSISDLNEDYSTVYETIESDLEGAIRIQLPKGVYYIRQVSSTKDIQVMSILFLCPIEENQESVLEPKVVYPSQTNESQLQVKEKNKVNSIKKDKNVTTSIVFREPLWILGVIGTLVLVLVLIKKRQRG